VIQPLPALEPFLVDAELAIVNQLIAFFTQQQHNARRIELNRSSLPGSKVFSDLLGASPQSSTTGNFFIMDSRLLDTPSPLADEKTFDRASKDNQQRLTLLEKETSLTAWVERQLTADLTAPPALHTLAGKLGNSPRQLRYLLKKEGSSYHQILRDVRLRYVISAMEGGSTTVAEMAYHLGYEEPTNFTAAFKRWTGQAPLQFKQGLLQQK
jgi:AraC-like DNA-binding protein